jgi:hypothetical protein
MRITAGQMLLAYSLNKKNVLVFVLTFIGFSVANAQKHYRKADENAFKVYGEVGGMVSTSGQTPFWIRSNQNGTTPLNAPLLNGRLGMYAEYSKPVRNDFDEERDFDYGYGLELIGNAINSNDAVVAEAYFKGRWKAGELSVGRRRSIVGICDTLLSSGAYSGSGNALPIPKVELSLPNYIPLGFTEDFFSFKGSIAHGWFDNNRKDVSGSFFHQKSLSIRLGKPDWKVKFYSSINHSVQWGGKELLGLKADLPSDLKAFWYMFSGTPVVSDSSVTTVGNEAQNRVGNHLGSIDLGLELDFENSSILLYRQNVYEDGSLFFLTNIADGLNGIRWKNKVNIERRQTFYLKQLTLEMLYTKSQGGPFFTQFPETRGADNYMNNTIYRDGWSYLGRGIGTPFIMPRTEFANQSPDYDDVLPTGERFALFTNNNRIIAWYLGFAATVFNDMDVEGRFSYSKNYGIYGTEFSPVRNQFSMSLKAIKPIDIWEGAALVATFGFDSGTLLKNTVGLYLGIRTTFTE